jgi:hypothetical protein
MRRTPIEEFPGELALIEESRHEFRVRRYEFVENAARKDRCPLRQPFEAAGVSRSAYYAWSKRPSEMDASHASMRTVVRDKTDGLETRSH